MKCWLLILALPLQTPEERAEGLRNAAALIQAADLNAAENALQALLKRAPEDPLALNLLGVVRLQQHDAAEATKLFQQAIATGHKIAGPHVNLATIYGSDRPLDAISELAQAIAIAPCPIAHDGKAACAPGDNQAVSLLHQIAKQSALNALKSGDKSQANAVLMKASAVLPNDPELSYDAGIVAFESGSYQDADRALSKALKLQPNYGDATYALARTYLAENLAKPAEDEMRKYLAEKPQDATAQYGLGYILMAEQKLEEAKVAFDESLKLQPNQTESIFQLGEIALQQGDPGAARDDFNKVLIADPHHAGASTEIGVMAYRAAHYDEAKSDFEHAVQSGPVYQKAHYYYALTLSRLGQKEQAEHEFAIAKSLQKEHAGEHFLLGTQP